MLFTLFRYGLIPVALWCVVVIAAGVDVFSSTVAHKSTWPQTIVTVVESQDAGDTLAEFRGKPNDFPDPYGTVSYVIGGKPYTWQGRGREMGVTVMKPGEKIKVFYNPEDPQEISTLVQLGAGTGSIIIGSALAFFVFYVWFFWLRRFLGRSAPPDNYDGDRAESFAGRVPRDVAGESEGSRFGMGDQRPVMVDNRPGRPSNHGGGRTSFGKR